MDEPVWLRNPSLDTERGTDIAPRPITIEQTIAVQIDRIAYLRSIGEPWAEALYQLRDMTSGLEDEEFWDGVPGPLRSKALQDAGLREKYRVYGWEGVPCRAIQTPSGPRFMPTNEDLSRQLRIVLLLLARRGITWKRLRTSRVGVLHGSTADLDGSVSPDGGSPDLQEP